MQLFFFKNISQFPHFFINYIFSTLTIKTVIHFFKYSIEIGPVQLKSQPKLNYKIWRSHVCHTKQILGINKGLWYRISV